MMCKCVLCGNPTLQAQGWPSTTKYSHEQADAVSVEEVRKDLADNDEEIRVLGVEIDNRKKQSEFLREHLQQRGADERKVGP